ncbi:hypothetical protein HMPREF9244_00579, partial [Alloscardovia omnicolens F0580]
MSTRVQLTRPVKTEDLLLSRILLNRFIHLLCQFCCEKTASKVAYRLRVSTSL